MPKRIQRKRTKGWRMPDGAVYVGRPTKWGNPFKMIDPTRLGHQEAVERFRRWIGRLDDKRDYLREVRAELRGKDLVCWCPVDQPCHADVLLDIANQ